MLLWVINILQGAMFPWRATTLTFIAFTLLLLGGLAALLVATLWINHNPYFRARHRVLALSGEAAGLRSSIRPIAIKVPAIALSFWLLRILATTVGGTGGDALSMNLNLGYATSTQILCLLFFLLLTIQIQSRKCHRFLYWTLVAAAATTSTTLADYFIRQLGSAAWASLSLGVLLGALLLLWRRLLGRLSSDNVQDRRTEGLYWAAIFLSNTLGVALGDFFSEGLGLGYVTGVLILSAALAFVLAGYSFARISRNALFWIALIFTAPLGAMLGDWLTMPAAKGALDLNRFNSSFFLIAVMAFCIIFLGRRTRVPS